MAGIKPAEVSEILKKQLEGFNSEAEYAEIGTVLQVGDGIARVYGLSNIQSNEMVEFDSGVMGIVLNLEEDSVGAVIFGPDNPDRNIKEGDVVKRTGKIAQVPVGQALLGRVVNALGSPIDDKGPIVTDRYRPLESPAPSVVSRQAVKEPIQTGLKAIDAMIPIGRGQRELIIGDRQTGKTAIAIDTIINQKDKGVYCVYVGIGQKMANIVAVAEILKKYGAMEYTTIVSASSGSSASQQYLAPYAGCAIGEEFLYSKWKRHVLLASCCQCCL